MKLEQFIATEQRLTAAEFCQTWGHQPDEIAAPHVLVYATGLYIEDRGENHTAANLRGGRYYLLLERDDWLSDDLPELQRRLYEWADAARFR